MIQYSKITGISIATIKSIRIKMTQLNNSNNLTTQPVQTSDSDTYTYNDAKVKIITVFTDNGKSTALVEDEKGELFEVERDSLR